MRLCVNHYLFWVTAGRPALGAWEGRPGIGPLSWKPELILMMLTHWNLIPATEKYKHMWMPWVTLDYAKVSPEPAPMF